MEIGTGCRVDGRDGRRGTVVRVWGRHVRVAWDDTSVEWVLTDLLLAEGAR